MPPLNEHSLDRRPTARDRTADNNNRLSKIAC